MAVSGKFLPSNSKPTQMTGGVPTGSGLSEKKDMGKFLPGGEQRLTGGVSGEIPEKGEMGKFLPRGQKRMVQGV